MFSGLTINLHCSCSVSSLWLSNCFENICLPSDFVESWISNKLSKLNGYRWCKMRGKCCAHCRDDYQVCSVRFVVINSTVKWPWHCRQRHSLIFVEWLLIVIQCYFSDAFVLHDMSRDSLVITRHSCVGWHFGGGEFSLESKFPLQGWVAFQLLRVMFQYQDYVHKVD